MFTRSVLPVNFGRYAQVDRFARAQKSMGMQMTEAFASAVAVTVPIFALAAGAEARGIRDRLRKPDPHWEREFAAYSSEHELDLSGPPTEVFGYLKGVPKLSRLYKVERKLAMAGALVWLVVFVLLGVTELQSLAWLADGAQRGDPRTAQFAIVSIGIAMFTLILAPVVYFLVPLRLGLDLLPHGLKAAVGPKLADKSASGFLKRVLSELEGAVERAGESYEKERAAPDPAASSAPPTEPLAPPEVPGTPGAQ